MGIVSYFNQSPEFYGVKITARGDDGYWNASDMARAMKSFDGVSRPFSRWARTKTAKRALSELSDRLGVPIMSPDGVGSYRFSHPYLVDYDRASGDDVWVHPEVGRLYGAALKSAG